jgi:hypothetical protein
MKKRVLLDPQKTLSEALNLYTLASGTTRDRTMSRPLHLRRYGGSSGYAE